MVTYCVPTYRSFDLCEKSIDAVMSGTLTPDSIYVTDDSGTYAGADLCDKLIKKYPNITFRMHAERKGVAKTWNEFFTETDAEYLIIANDDIEVHPDTLVHLVAAAELNSNNGFFAGAGKSGNAFSFFLLRRKLWQELGGFDERFFPAYFEDNDFHMRMKLIGQDIITVEAATYNHVGSSTIARYTGEEMVKHHEQFKENRAYYHYKWGGLPGDERYTKPFNGR